MASSGAEITQQQIEQINLNPEAGTQYCFTI
jgi:hypothetical protein